MWQLDYANELFMASGGPLGKPEICYDANTELWEYNSDAENDSDDDRYSSEDSYSCDDTSDSDLDDILPEEQQECDFVAVEDGSRYSFRKRTLLH